MINISFELLIGIEIIAIIVFINNLIHLNKTDGENFEKQIKAPLKKSKTKIMTVA